MDTLVSRCGAVALLALGLTLAGCDLGGGEPAEPAPKTVTVDLGKQVNPQAPEVVIDPGQQLGPLEQAQADDASPADEGPGIHEDLRDESPPGAPADAVAEVLKSPARGRTQPQPAGGAQNYNCASRPVRNQSARATGAKVGIFVLHYTVSRPGSINAIRGLFDRPSFGASSHLGLEPLSGECQQWVPYARKAWTQGAFNSVSESVEIMAMGSEPRFWWLSAKIIRQGVLASIVADRLRARGIPARRVDPIGCEVQVAGWTDHDALECGNTHHDVSPAFPYAEFAAQVKRAYGGSTSQQGHTTCDLRVRSVQAALTRKGYELAVDGVAGPQTRAAIREFQQVRGLNISGVAGRGTALALGLCRKT